MVSSNREINREYHFLFRKKFKAETTCLGITKGDVSNENINRNIRFVFIQTIFFIRKIKCNDVQLVYNSFESNVLFLIRTHFYFYRSCKLQTREGEKGKCITGYPYIELTAATRNARFFWPRIGSRKVWEYIRVERSRKRIRRWKIEEFEWCINRTNFFISTISFTPVINWPGPTVAFSGVFFSHF